MMWFTILFETRISGSYYELGVNQGKLLKGAFTLPPAPQKKIELMYGCEEIIQTYYPEILDELRGVADGLEVDFEGLKTFILLLGIEPGCTVFAISSEYTASGYPLFARNYDWFDWAKEYFTTFWTRPNDKYSSLAFTDHFVGRYGGVNEKGVAIAVTAIPGGRGLTTPGMRMNLSTRWVLDHCKCTQDAVAFFEKVPQVTHHSFLIADKDNTFARVETDTDDVAVTYAADGFLATTNHYQADTMLQYETVDNIPLTSKPRLQHVTEWFHNTKRPITPQTIMLLLKTHAPELCAHHPGDDMPASTLWSWIAPLGKRELMLCEGSPCSNEYRAFEY